VTLSTEKCLPSSCINRGGNINKEIIPSQSNPPPHLKGCLNNRRLKVYSKSFLTFNDIHHSIVRIPFSQYIQSLDLKITSILHIWFSLIVIYMLRISYSLLLRPTMKKENRMVNYVVKCCFI